MKQDCMILEEDKQWAKARIDELEKQIQELGPEFYDVFNQSSETWHDNAPFDALRDRQSVLDAERQHLRNLLRKSAVSVPKAKKGVVGIGSVVKVLDKEGKQNTYRIAGNWTYRAGKLIDGARIVSSETPLARALISKKVGTQTDFGEILSIEV